MKKTPENFKNLISAFSAPVIFLRNKYYRFRLSKKLAHESRIGSEDSMRVLAEFEKLKN